MNLSRSSDKGKVSTNGDYNVVGRKKFCIGYVISDLFSGGAQQHIALLCSHLDISRYETIVFCQFQKGPFIEELKRANIPVIMLAGNFIYRMKKLLSSNNNGSLKGSCPNGKRKITSRVKGVIRSGGMCLAELLSGIHLFFQVHYRKIDLISAHLFGAARGGLLPAWLAGIPACFTEHGIINETWYSKKELSILKRYLPLAQKVIAVSNRTAESLQKGLGLPTNQIEVIGHASLVDYCPTEVTWGEFNFPIKIVIIGRMIPRKGHSCFIKAAGVLSKKYTSANFLIAGDGEIRSSLEKEAEDLGLKDRMEFVGQYANDDLPKILHGAWVVAIPSETESFGIVALEAMACGIPVVAANVEGLNEVVVDGETGLLVPPNNPVALAEGISNLLEDKTLRVRLRKNGLALAKKYSPDSIVNKTMSVYQRIK